MARRADHGQSALFLAEGSDALALDGLGTLPTTPIAELDLPRELAPGVIATPTTSTDYDHAHITADDAARCATCVQHDAAKRAAFDAENNRPEQRAARAEMFRSFGWTS